MSGMPSSWQIRLAALLVGLGAVLGVAMVVLAVRLLDSDPGFLFAILPVVVTALACAGLFLASVSLMMAVRLWTGATGARLQTMALGCVLLVTGAASLAYNPVVGLLIAFQGLALVALMTSPAAKTDLGGWADSMKQPAPWGSQPGAGLWSDEPVQQGPWSPDPTTVPWFTRKPESGPQPPWWQTWEVALAQGIPLWEALLLGLALLGCFTGTVLVFLNLGHRIEGGPVLLIAVSLGVVWLLERRMRARLSGR